MDLVLREGLHASAPVCRLGGQGGEGVSPPLVRGDETVED